MRVAVLFVLILVGGASPAGLALAANIGPKPRLPPPPSETSADVGLRGSLSATRPPGPPLGSPLGPPLGKAGLPAPGLGLSGMASAGLSTPPAITPLRPIGDPAPICRAQCAEARYTCAAGEDADCETKWSQCVVDCSAPSLR